MNKVKCPKCLNDKKVRDGAKFFLCCNSRHDVDAHLTAWEELRTPEEEKAFKNANATTLIVEKPKVEEIIKVEEKRDLSEVYRYQCGKCGSFFDDYEDDGEYLSCPNKKCNAVLEVKNNGN